MTLNGGLLDIRLIGDYEPDYLDAFVVITAGSRIGEFGSINGQFINPDKTLVTLYDYDTNVGVTVVAGLPGDADLNGSVGISDLGIWLANAGKPTTGGWQETDFDFNGVVGVSDLGEILSRIGKPSPSPASFPQSATAIPEPSSAMVVVILAA